ncbi:MAG: type I-E CRISPR-associated protein Cse1/CasA [Ramlibacter sp.]|nr:type I-E CRISPR-associated protein Cse1/CasA [Ramlibacter sp.]
MTLAPKLKFSLLDEALIRYRAVADGRNVNASLPQLMVALAADEVRDYPALRPHQRHPWHAFLVQLAAITMHGAGRLDPFSTEAEWRAALLALTPDDGDGAAWCLVSPPDRPALLQAPVPAGHIDDWKSVTLAADELDMLVTSKNHDLKAGRARRSKPEDWLYSLLSLQTQEGFLGAGNYGISRMNGGFASRPGVGIAGTGHCGARWRRDLRALLATRERTAEARGLQSEEGLALVWLVPWDGLSSLSFSTLDPHYIEICRRVRLQSDRGGIRAVSTGSKAARILSKELNGVTGDPWTPVETEAGKALTISAEGFHYKLVAELLFGSKYQAAVAQDMSISHAGERYVLIAQGVTRGQGKTEGYHERRVPISPKVRGFLVSENKAPLARISTQRIAVIAEVRKLLWLALAVLFNNGAPGKDISDSVKDKASEFSHPFERAENARFFEDLNDEIEAADPTARRLQWLQGLVERAAAVLNVAFGAGPRGAIQRYRAQAAALSRFHGALRGDKSPLPELTNHYRQQAQTRQQEETHDHD